MNASALPLTRDFGSDASLGAILEALGPHPERKLVIAYAGRTVQSGYHVTEVKAGSFITLDCGGSPNAWRETILQVEDLPASAETPDHMKTERFLAILHQVAQRVTLDPAARLTFEVGLADQPMQVFDVETLRIEAEQVIMQLGPRPAICKPRHRAQQKVATTCCAPKNKCS